MRLHLMMHRCAGCNRLSYGRSSALEWCPDSKAMERQLPVHYYHRVVMFCYGLAVGMLAKVFGAIS